MSIQLNCLFKPCNQTLFQILSSVMPDKICGYLNEIYAYLRLWNSIHDLCKTNDNCILGVVSISKGMVSIFLQDSWNTVGTLKCVGLMQIYDATQPKHFQIFFLKKVVKYLIKDSAFKRIFISVKTPTVRNFSWYQTHVHLLPSVA